MLKVVLNREGSFPILYCEGCGEPIKENRGIAAYGEPEGAPGSHGVVDAHFFHHGRCDDKKRFPYSLNLDNFFYNLLHNAGIKPKRMAIFEAGTDHEVIPRGL